MSFGGPVLRVLGIPDWADAFELLGLAPEECSPAAIEKALQAQLARTYRHPEGSGASAEFVRRKLRKAAEILRDPRQREIMRGRSPEMRGDSALSAKGAGGNGAMQLTTFDRAVLAVLIACGGWNAASRARLVSLSAVHGVSPQGLLKVIAGLGEYAQRGGGRLDVSAITHGAARFEEMPLAPVPAEAESNDWITAVMPEFRRGGFLATVKLSVLFGSITLLLAVLFIRVLLSEPPGPPAPSLVELMDRPLLTIPSEPLGDPAKIDRDERPALVQFSEPPTFRGNAAPREAVDAGDQAPRLPDEINVIVRHLTVSSTPSLSRKQDWRVLTATGATAWLRIDEALDRAIRRQIVQAIVAASDRPTVADELLTILAEPLQLTTAPLDHARGAWLCGVLAQLATWPDLPPSVTDRAEALLRAALGAAWSPDKKEFTAAARARLNNALPELVRITPFDATAFDQWELWLAAHARIGRDETYQESIAEALRALIVLDTDLGTLNPVTRVVGRLLFLLDLRSSDLVRERVLALYDDADVTSHDLWVLGGLLLQSGAMPWFEQNYVVPVDAERGERSRRRRLLMSAWPPAARSSGPVGTRLVVNPALLREWKQALEHHEQVHDLNVTRFRVERQERWMEPLLVLAALNQAATALSMRQDDAVETAMKRMVSVETITRRMGSAPGSGPGSAPAPGPSPRPPGALPPSLPIPLPPQGAPSNPGGGQPRQPGQPGQMDQRIIPFGIDGEWSRSYEAARNAEQRLEHLRVLRVNATVDLGPIDARMFVQIAYRGSPGEVRQFAQATLIETLSLGRAVALEMLEQFTDASRSEAISDFIMRYTGSVLPVSRSDSWPIEARLALAQHVLRLHDREQAITSIDDAAAALAVTYRAQWLLVTGARETPETALQPEFELQRLLDAWRSRARGKVIMSVPYDSLGDLERRAAIRDRLASGTISRHVALQITLLEYMAYCHVAEQPTLAEPVGKLLHEAAVKRSTARGILEQAVAVELAIARLWRLRFEAAQDPTDA